MKAELDQIVNAIVSERQYQQEKWPNQGNSIGDYILILEKILSDAKRAWIRGDGSVMHEIRQVTTVGVACMEDHGAPLRGDPIVDTKQPPLGL